MTTFQKVPRDAVVELDPVTIDIIEGALGNARLEMDAVMSRTAMSPAIRDQHDCFPMICDHKMRMIVGQFGTFIADMISKFPEPIEEGDVLMTSSPYQCNAAVSHANDWLVLVPVFAEGTVAGWAAMIGHMADVGGGVAGSLPTKARTIYEEGLLIPPIKIVRRGEMQREVLQILLTQVRLPEWNNADLNALIAACRVAERRIQETVGRFGLNVYRAALEALMERNRRAIAEIIKVAIPEERVSFEDVVDDDGRGNGPYRLHVSMWREGERVVIDWEGTDLQSEGPINYLANPDSAVRLVLASILIMAFDPQILANEGCFPLIDVRIPEGTIISPQAPAALSCRTHVATRMIDVLSGLIGKQSPALLCAAGMGSFPQMNYSGHRSNGALFQLTHLCQGGVGARPIGDGPDGHHMLPWVKSMPMEYMESNFPVRVERYESLPDSGGPGLYRGGNGVRVEYRFLASGEISLHDDRWLTPNWGVNGGLPGGRSRKRLNRLDGSTLALPSKCDDIAVEAGDVLEFVTWGGGGWGRPSQRDAALVARDVRCGLVTREGARRYGVVLDSDGEIDAAATETLRKELAGTESDDIFDFGPGLSERLARCLEETGLEAPVPPPQIGRRGW